MTSIKYLFYLIVLLILFLCRAAQRYTPDWKSLDTRPLPTWYDEAKVGIFIHWGVFSVPSTIVEGFWLDWKNETRGKSKIYKDFMAKNYYPGFTYQDFAAHFTAEFYEPNKWANIFKDSGAKYVVLTTKHHEGYTLWPSKASWNWNAMDVGPNRDLLGDLSTAVRNAGLHFGVYHSLYEWFNPLYLDDKASNFKTRRFVTTKTGPELDELVNIYKPDIIWSDGDDGAPSDTYWNSTGFLAWLYNDSPVKDKVVVNDRWGGGTSCTHGDFYNCYDQYNPGVVQKHKWENALKIDRNSWGFRREAQLIDFLTVNDLLKELVSTISCGGNILINIGPTRDGVIAPIFEERLKQVGSWLKVNGEAIYASKPWTHQNDTITKNVWYTSKDKIVYSIALDWPQNDQLVLGEVTYSTVNKIELLGVNGTLEFKENTDGKGIRVTFPHLHPYTLQWAYALKISTK